MGYSPWGLKESDTTEQLHFHFLFYSQLFVRPPQTTILPFAFLFLGNVLDHCLLYNVMKFPSSLEKLKLSLQERLRSFSRDTLKPRFVVNHLFGTVNDLVNDSYQHSGV